MKIEILFRIDTSKDEELKDKNFFQIDEAIRTTAPEGVTVVYLKEIK